MSYLKNQWQRRSFMAGARNLLLAGGCLALASCEPGSDLDPLPPAPPGPYRLGAADQLQVTTYGEERLSGKFRISDSGSLALPLIGTVRAAGLTTGELEQKVTQELENKNILVNPSVSIEVIEYRPIFVLGEVSKPGPYPFQPGMTVLTAVAVAGGFTYRAQTEHASILRTTRGRTVEGRVSRRTEVLPGDVVTIFERYF